MIFHMKLFLLNPVCNFLHNEHFKTPKRKAEKICKQFFNVHFNGFDAFQIGNCFHLKCETRMGILSAMFYDCTPQLGKHVTTPHKGEVLVLEMIRNMPVTSGRTGI